MLHALSISSPLLYSKQYLTNKQLAFIIPPWHEGVWKHGGKILYRLYVGIMQQPLYLRYA